jgi:YVTN family beta-propeller protein
MKKHQLDRSRAEGISRLRFFALALAIVLSSVSLALAQGSTRSNLSTNAGLPRNQLVATIPLGFNFFPEAIVVSPDSQTIYVSGFTAGNGGLISIINSQSNTVTDTIPLGGDLASMVITPDGSTLYVGDIGSKTIPSAVYAVSTASKTVTSTFNIFAAYLAVSPNGKTLYLTNASKAVAIIDTATNRIIPHAIELGSVGGTIAVSPNGKSAYVHIVDVDSVSAIDLATRQVTANIPLTPPSKGRAAFLTFAPAGHKLFINRGIFVFVVDTSTNTVVRNIKMPVQGAGVGQAAITPDGQFLYEPSGFDGSVVMLHTATHHPAGNPISVSSPEAVAVAPNASFAYVIGLEQSGNGDEGEVYVVNISPQ